MSRPESVWAPGTGLDHTEQALRVVHHHPPDDHTAQRVAAHERLLDAQVVEQGDRIFGHVGQAESGVHQGIGVAFPVAALVVGDAPVSPGHPEHGPLPPGGAGHVPVQEQHRDAVRVAGGQDPGGEPPGGDPLGLHTRGDR